MHLFRKKSGARLLIVGFHAQEDFYMTCDRIIAFCFLFFGKIFILFTRRFLKFPLFF